MAWFEKKFTKINVHGSHDFRRRKILNNEFVKFVLYSILGAIIFLLIYSLWFNPGSVERTFDNIKEAVSEGVSNIQSSTSPNSSLSDLGSEELFILSKCRQQYEEYSRIGEQKYDVDYTIIKIQEINSESEAEEFWELYGGPLQTTFKITKSLYGWEFNVYPIIMIGSSVRGPEMTMPVVLICDHNGDLLENSKKQLTG